MSKREKVGEAWAIRSNRDKTVWVCEWDDGTFDVGPRENRTLMPLERAREQIKWMRESEDGEWFEPVIVRVTFWRRAA